MTLELPKAGELFIDRYQLVELLGRGAFACVYRARDLEVGRDVALKVLAPRGGGYSQLSTARFLREGRVIAGLQSPHTITLYDFGESREGLFWMAYEFVAGRDLRVALADTGPLAERSVVHILEQLLRALIEAHGAGLVHRDIKPANILVHEYEGDPWCVKLLDFGLAKPTTPDATQLTGKGKTAGTPRYMSPEQVLGADLTAQSDIYSLGLVAYEMLTGEPAIDGADMKTLLREQVEGEPVRIGRGVSPALRKVVERMCARPLTERYSAASGVLVDLRRLRRPKVVRPRDANPPAPRDVNPPADSAPEPKSSSMSFELVVGILACAVVAILLVLSFTDDPVEREPPNVPAPTAARVNPLAPQDEPPQQPDAIEQEENQHCAAPFLGPGELRDDDISPSEKWLTYIPRSYDPQTDHPLVVFLHDMGIHPSAVLSGSRLNKAADRHGFVVIAPLGRIVGRAWADKDVERVQWLVEQTAQQLCIDETRIFVVGHGVGGSMADTLSCTGKVAATANFSYGRTDPTLPCKDARPHMEVIPMESRWQPREGGPNCLNTSMVSLAETTQMLRQRNGCDGPPQLTDAKKMTCQAWACDQPLKMCEREGGQPWPGAGGRTTDVFQCDGPSNPTPLFPPIFDFFGSLER